MNFDKVKAALEAKGFEVSCFQTATDAVTYMDSEIDGKTVGIGGSMTVEEMGLYDKLRLHNNVIWHMKSYEGKARDEVISEANAAQIYISSVNGIAETGEIINIDGTCNRVAATLYGHEKVYFVIGANKLAPDYDSALHRARNIAAPLNAKRLNKKTPCAINADKCYDCNSPDRICCGLVVLWSKPRNAKYEVILINEKLGY
ncbi:MAG: lactate utilization protein [Clostridia bacterium]|nr:lactate utilization protein [Clostridia bacterium]